MINRKPTKRPRSQREQRRCVAVSQQLVPKYARIANESSHEKLKRADKMSTGHCLNSHFIHESFLTLTAAEPDTYTGNQGHT